MFEFSFRFLVVYLDKYLGQTHKFGYVYGRAFILQAHKKDTADRSSRQLFNCRRLLQLFKFLCNLSQRMAQGTYVTD